MDKEAGSALMRIYGQPRRDLRHLGTAVKYDKRQMPACVALKQVGKFTSLGRS